MIFTVRLHVMQRTVFLSQFCPFVHLSDACIVTKLSDMHCGYFDTTRNGNHSSLLTPIVLGGRRFPCEIFAESDPLPL